MDDTNIIKKILGFVKENGTAVTIITTVITMFFTYAYKLCAYWFYKGRYDYFNIPSEFIEINYEVSFWGFLRAASIVFTILAVAILSCLYDIGQNTVSFERKVSLVEINEQEYIVISKYGENWIVKRCIRKEEEFYSDSEHYMLIDVSEKDIFVKGIDAEKNIIDYMVDREAFDIHQKRLESSQ